MRYLNPSATGDPSSIQQSFLPFTPEVLSCHYWWLGVWKHKRSLFPYWRIYKNSRSGATIQFEGKNWALTPESIAIVAPNTPFSTDYDPDGIAISRDDYLVGGSVKSLEQEGKCGVDVLEHLFIHFRLRSPYDRVKPNIFIVEPEPYISKRIDELCEFVKLEPERFGCTENLLLSSIIADLLYQIPGDEWGKPLHDERIKATIEYIDTHISEKLSNEALAKLINMAANSFARLFRNEMGITLQQYVLKQRVNKACAMLHHSNCSIEQVAEECGFCDRYHFSRMFKKIADKSPADYRNSLRFL